MVLILKVAASVAFAVATGAIMSGIVGQHSSLVWRYWLKYTLGLERKLRSMYIWTPGRHIAVGQLIGVALVLALAITVDLPYWWAVLIVVIGYPPYKIERMRKARVEHLESQIVDFLMALANSLRAVPGVSSALLATQPLLRTPLKEEMDLALKEMRVGSTMEQALVNMGVRVGSTNLDSALTAILIGKQLGGDLPFILERTASAMREMERLDGVIRTKTAEGKAQLWVLAVAPGVLVFALSWASPGYFDPLTDSFVGYIIIAIAMMFWVASLLVARKVLAVDV